MAHPYCAPLADMRFLLLKHPPSRADADVQVLSELATFAQEQWAPLNAMGDAVGCSFEQGQVSLPPGVKAALRRYLDGGWLGMTLPEYWGGQALSATLASFAGEVLSTANPALSMFAALTTSACKTILAFGSDALKEAYLPKMVSGEWTGTMCMTEAHCGSDLGLIKATAVQLEDGDYAISGNKIFISGGEHDGSANIIHLVLARIKGAPEGSKGLSLFVVPKWLPNSGAANAVHCLGIENKMGIHANPTCTLSFEQARGQLLGKPHEGLKAMFTMMNEMRLGAALQGVGLSERAFQQSHDYATSRTQGKALDRANQSEGQPDALVCHADVRRMLLTQQVFAEGGRALCHHCALLLDTVNAGGEQGKLAEKMLGMLTPIAKAFLTETGLESASLAIQVHGGHGFIRDNGVEQSYRDGRIATLYEGTTGIQALDLLGRKVLGDQGQTLLAFTQDIRHLCEIINQDTAATAQVKAWAQQLLPWVTAWPELVQQIGVKAMDNREEVGAAAYDFLMYSGYVCLAYFWLRTAHAVSEAGQDFAPIFLASKQTAAAFYFARILPRAHAHQAAMSSGREVLSMGG